MKNIFLSTLMIIPVLLHSQKKIIDWNSWDVIPGEVIINYKSSAAINKKTIEQLNSIGLAVEQLEKETEKKFKKINPSNIYRYNTPNIFIGKFDPNQLEKILNFLSKDTLVQEFEPNRKTISKATWGTPDPDDPLLPLWGMERIGSSVAWEFQSSAISSIRVAICEGTQFWVDHPDLNEQVSSVQNGPNTIIADHPTHVAGTVAATGNNNIGVAGVANVEIISLDNTGTLTDFIQSISWALNNDIQVINMSFGFCEDSNCDPCQYAESSNAVQNAINNASEEIVFVGSAGNDSCEIDDDGDLPIPAGYDNVIAVSALNQFDNIASFSNFGEYIDLTAPGVGINSTVLNGYESMPGTSMAAPHVSGAAGAILSINPNFPAKSIVRLLKLTAEDIGPNGEDDSFGHGVVRVDNAIFGIADMYAESSYSGPEVGHLHLPFNTVSEVINEINNGQTIGLVGGSLFNENITIIKPCTIISVGGNSIIGQ